MPEQVTVTLNKAVARTLLLAAGTASASPDATMRLQQGKAAIRDALDQTPSREGCERCGGTSRIECGPDQDGTYPAKVLPAPFNTLACPDCSQPSGEEGDGEGAEGMHWCDECRAWVRLDDHVHTPAWLAAHPHDQSEEGEGEAPGELTHWLRWAAGELLRVKHVLVESGLADEGGGIGFGRSIDRLVAVMAKLSELAAHPHDQEAPQVSSGQGLTTRELAAVERWEREEDAESRARAEAEMEERR